MGNTYENNGVFGATGFTTSAPTVADTVPPAFRQALVEASLADAEWIRPPAPRGRCRLSGLSRSKLIELGESGAFKLIRLRKRDAVRGVILIEKKSLLEFLRSIPAEGKTEGDVK